MSIHPATAALIATAPQLVELAQHDENVLEALMRFDRIARNLPELDAMTGPKVESLVDARLRTEAATIRRLLDQAA